MLLLIPETLVYFRKISSEVCGGRSDYILVIINIQPMPYINLSPPRKEPDARCVNSNVEVFYRLEVI